MAFQGFLDVRLIRDDVREVWELLAPFAYKTHNGVLITVDKGFQTDFMSIPRIPLVYDILGNRGRRLGVVHDWVYKTAMFPRKVCDDLVFEMGRECGFSHAEMWEIYVAVRMCGAPHYGTE
jgi:hypothetical protein